MHVYCTITAKNGERVPIEVSDDDTATMIRRHVSSATMIPLSQLRLIFRGRMIKDDDSIRAVEEYKLEPDCVLHCMGKPDEDSTPAQTVSPVAASAVDDTSAASGIPRGMPPTAATAPTTNTTAASGPLTVASAVLRLRQNNPPSVYETALTTLDKILNNIVTHPLEEKYRKVKRQNAAFSKRLGGLVGGHDCMLAVGFYVQMDGNEEVYQMQASPENWPKLVEAEKTVSNAAEQAKQQRQQQQPASVPSNNLFAGSGGRLPGIMGSAGGDIPSLDPAMQNTLSQMMSNPESVRAALQVS